MDITAITDWLTGNMGTAGEYQYQAIHGYTAGIVFAVLLAVCCLARTKRLNKRQKRGILVAICVFQLSFEMLWRLVYLLVKKDSMLCWWPVYPCNLGGILVPVISLKGWKPGKRLFYLFGFVGGVLTFALPEGIFCSDVMTFPILKSVLQHTGLLLIPCFEHASGTYRTSLRDYGWVVAGGFVHIFNCEIIDRLLGFTGDYMFFRSGMPFVIPGVPQFLTLSVFAALVLAALCYLSDPAGSVECIRKRHREKLPMGLKGMK